ncbi:hypothetical protein [Geofilum rubicundum]|uniref:Uncharacterized protein n=1 Tax=Geofilum rubicundum JCM 15548 TaxID=1236989 RepID=A0A0E9M1K5_9BACT|nr:hypothetical protein [Geofilum rubicundum]GAO31035.1 hypothetical protein JCM15548_13369 [Geofilum rubicundum JCM 15548]
MIEMLAELVAGILGLIRKGDYKRASQSIDHAYQDLLKQDAGFFDKIPLNQLTDSLVQEHNYTNGHLEILSELIYSQAELFYAQKNYNKSLEYYQKSRFLLEFIIKDTQSFSIEKQSRLSYLENRMAELENEAH